MTTKYDHEVVHHDPHEGFDRTEPDSRKITMFVIGSVLLLIITILALQSYFDKLWNELTYERVLSVPGEELGQARNLEAWRLTHYEYTDATRKNVRIPLD